MTKNCAIIWAGILAASICIAIGVLTMLPRSAVTKANFDRIKTGMTLAEVEEILGEKGSIAVGEYRHGNWIGDDGSNVSIIFEDDLTVGDARWYSSGEEPILTKIRRLLHLP